MLILGSQLLAVDLDTLVNAVKKQVGERSITLTVLYPEGALPNIQPVADIFTQRTGVTIQFLKTTVDDINTKMLLTAAQEKSDYDIALPATFGIPDLVEGSALLDLTEYARIYERKITYEPSLYEIGDYYKGRRYGYQTDGDAYVMFYLKDWLEDSQEKRAFESKYNKPLDVPKTWQELDQMMAFFHRPEAGKYGGCMFRVPRYMVWEWWIRFHASGALPIKENMRANINAKEGVAALEAMMAATAYQHPSVKTNGLFENWKEYAKGQCFANIGWGGSQKYFNSDASQIKGRLLHSPTPEMSHFNWGWNYVVSKYTKHPEIAYLFTLFATRSETSTISVRENGFFDPFRKEHYQDSEIIDVYTRSFLQAHQQAMTNPIPDFYIQGQGRYIQALQEAIVSTFEGYVSPKEALDFAAREWDRLTDEIGRESQQRQWEELRSMYPR